MLVYIRIKSNDDEQKVKLVYSTPAAQKRWYNLSIMLRGNACPNSARFCVHKTGIHVLFSYSECGKKKIAGASPTMVSGNQHNSTHKARIRKSCFFFRVRKN